jgi:multicomponent Na+:H+ antiporter subunit C
MIYILVSILFFIGLYGVLVKRNIIKVIIGIVIMSHSVNLLLILLGYRKNGQAPILQKGMPIQHFIQTAVDPLPQALVLTAIVVDLAMVIFLASLAIRLYEQYGTFDMDKIRRLKE